MQETRQKADTFLKSGKYFEAASFYIEALRQSPDDARLWANLGNALVAAGDRGQALEAYGHAVRLCPDNAMMHYNYGSSLLDGDRLEKARLHLDESARLKPEFSWTFDRLGTLYHQMNDRAKALRNYDKAMALRPKDIGLQWRRCLAELSICYENEETVSEARRNYEERLAVLRQSFAPNNRQMLATALDGLRETPFYLAY